MSVNIGISANPTQAVAAFDTLREAMRRAGQEGRAFRDMDFSHPELSGLSTDLTKMQTQLEDLMRVSQGATARAARRVFGTAPGGANPLDWQSHDADWERHFPDEAERNRLRGRVQGFVTGGTQFAPAPPTPPAPAPPPPGPPPPSPPPPPQYSNEAEDAAKGLPPIVKSAARAAVQGATFGLSMAGIGGIRSAISNSYHSAVDEGASSDNLFRRMPELSQSFETLRESVRRASDGMGITYQEAQRMAGIFVRTRGDPRDQNAPNGERDVAGWVKLSAGFGRSAGVEGGTSMGLFSRASNFQDGEKFAMLVGDAAAKGFQTGNMERVMESIVRYQESTSRILVGNGGNVEGFAGMWAAMNATGSPGMRGDNATALIGQLDNAVRQGGMGGHASEAVTWKAFAKAGVKDPYEMQYLQEGGMFAKVGKGTLFDAVSGEINSDYRGVPKKQRLAALARHFGISMHQAEAMQGLQPANVTGTRDLLEGYGIDPTKMNPTAFVDIAKAQGSGDWEGGRKRLLDRSDLSDDEKRMLKGASGDLLKETVVRTMATHGMANTSSSDHTDASTGLQNRMTEFGDLVVKPMTALKSGITDLADAIKSLGQLVVGGAGGNGWGVGLPKTNDADPNGVIKASFRMPSMGSGGAGANAAAGVSMNTNSATKAAFIAKWGPEAQRIAAQAGTTPENILGHWGQETGWGAHEHDNNVGNLQALSSGADTVTRGDTHADGSKYQAPFKRFDSPSASADAYLSWIQRHGAVGPGAGDTPEAFGGRLRNKHYMENPNAPADIGRAARGLHLDPAKRTAPAIQRPEAISASFEPLRVIHEDKHGNRLHEEELNVRPIGPPAVYGAA